MDLKEKNRLEKTMTLKVAVDVDGVLADQVSLVLKRLNLRYGLTLRKDDITEWDYKIMDTNIKIEIEKALLERDYVLSLPVIQGSKEGMEYLFKNCHVTVATARPKKTEDATREWVSSRFKYHDFCNTTGKSKDCVNSDILIDDYIPNIKEFSKGKGIGLLFSQPWNQDRKELENLIRRNKVFCCDNWKDVIATVKISSNA
jgi:5'(3')-deoxyribonucleotidase